MVSPDDVYLIDCDCVGAKIILRIPMLVMYVSSMYEIRFNEYMSCLRITDKSVRDSLAPTGVP
jgi:hypothetical protein